MEARESNKTAVVTAQLMEHRNASTLLLLLVLGFSTWQAGGTANGTVAGGGARPLVPAILVFGDSIVDTGNNNAVLTLTRADFSPYGKDLNGGVPTGRFSNGRIPPDFLGSCLSSIIARLSNTRQTNCLEAILLP